MSDLPSEARLQELARDRFNRPLPKRFYKLAEVGPDNTILLDGRSVKTPMKAVLGLPGLALAEAIVAEWNAQEIFINAATMPLTAAANTAIDRAVSERDNVLDEITRYAGSDLVCYRAETPQSLVAQQNAIWNSIIADAEKLLDTRFVLAAGIVHVAQSDSCLAAFRVCAASLDGYRLTALFNLTTLTGSALIGLGLVSGFIDAETGWTAAHVDEDFQITHWGWDDEAKKRRVGRRADYDGLLHFLNLVARS